MCKEKEMIEYMVDIGLFNYKQLLEYTLRGVKPPQVGGMSMKPGFKKRYDNRKAFPALMDWLEEQPTGCIDCGNTLDTQLDHVKPISEFDNPDDAHYLDNFEIRCRRCNTRKRKYSKNDSHDMSTAAMHMSIILKNKPKTYKEMKSMFKDSGLTLRGSDREAWAMAVWLNRDGKYEIER